MADWRDMALTQIATGGGAIRRVALLLPTAQPLVWTDQFNTPIRVETGAIWGGDRMFVTASGGEAVFTVGNRLYRQSPGEFVRDFYLIAIGQGAQRAAWLIPIAQAEMLICMTLVGNIGGSLGTAAGITVTFGRITSFYTSNRSLVHLALEGLGPVLYGLNEFRRRCPQLFWLLLRGLASQAGQSALQGISATDVAYFLTLFLAGAGRLPEATLRGLLTAAASALASTAISRAPGAAVQGAPAQAQRMVQQLRESGINIAEAEALRVATENCVGQTINQRQLRELVTNVNRVMPTIDALIRSMAST